jgi:hypothetical protein
MHINCNVLRTTLLAKSATTRKRLGKSTELAASVTAFPTSDSTMLENNALRMGTQKCRSTSIIAETFLQHL